MFYELILGRTTGKWLGKLPLKELQLASSAGKADFPYILINTPSHIFNYTYLRGS